MCGRWRFAIAPDYRPFLQVALICTSLLLTSSALAQGAAGKTTAERDGERSSQGLQPIPGSESAAPTSQPVAQPPVAESSAPAGAPADSWQPDGGRTVGARYGVTPPPAEGASGDAATSGVTPGISMGEYFKVLGWLVGVVILAVGTIYGLKKLQAKTARLGGGAKVMEVVSRTGLTAKHQLVMVRVAERVLIVGVSPDGVHPVAEFTDPKEVVQISRGDSFQEQLDAQNLDVAALENEEKAESVDVAPYRREIRHLKDLIGSWKRGSKVGGRR